MTPKAFNPADAHGSIRAVLRIQTPPEWDPRTGTVRPGKLYGFDSGERGGPADDLISLVTSKQLDQPAGRFTLNFVPREVEEGRTWADLIPAYSLVEIWLQRWPENPQPVLVMLGLSGPTIESEDYSNAEPERTIQVTGWELSVIFADQRILYLPVPPEEQAYEVLPDPLARPLSSSVVTTSVTPRATSPAQRGQPATATPEVSLFGMLAIDPELAQEGATPVDAIGRFVQMVTTGVATDYNKHGLPLLNFEFPDATLKDLLFFDAKRARRDLFDPQAQLPASAQLPIDRAALWSLMTAWCDPYYQEMFPLTRDTSLDTRARFVTTLQRAAIEIVFRKKPFAGRINSAGEVVGVASSVGTQFDPDFGDANTTTIADSDVASISVACGFVDRISNVYLVYPQASGIGGPDWRAIQTPLADNHPLAPSSVVRFGSRPMEVPDYYIRLDGGEGPINWLAVASARQRLLWAWHRFEPLFRRGSYTLRGHAEIQVGSRLVHVGRNMNREYYVTGLTHSMLLGDQQPRFLTRVEVERGWDLG